MLEFAGHSSSSLLAAYGCWAVLLFVAMESTGLPVPGETMLLAASIYAGTTHRLAIAWVIAAAAAGAVLGDNLGFLAGRGGGYHLLNRYGRYVFLDDRRLKLGQYLFEVHGGKVVFFGRFVAVLRVWSAFLAGAHRMSWSRFLACNAAGGVLWATLMGLGAYAFGGTVLRVAGPAVTIVLGALIVCGVCIAMRRAERRLAQEAEYTYQPQGTREGRPCSVAA